jgi:DNA-binding transcriptional ArsR family regulator
VDQLKGDYATLDRILRALGHPIRRRILRALLDAPGSASSLARDFGLDLSAVSYHLNRVLAKECEAVELVETIPKRGSLEKIYRLKAGLWTDFPTAPRRRKGDSRALEALSPSECFLEAAEALDGEVFGRLNGSAWEWFPVAVDDKAWKAIGAARKDFNRRVEAAVAESKGRDRGRRIKVHDVIVGAAAFPTTRSGASS